MSHIEARLSKEGKLGLSIVTKRPVIGDTIYDPDVCCAHEWKVTKHMNLADGVHTREVCTRDKCGTVIHRDKEGMIYYYDTTRGKQGKVSNSEMSK